MTLIFELNDTDLSLYRGTQRLYHAPAIALARDDRVLFGEPALRLSRMHPQQTNQHYFYRMNADPLAQPIPCAGNHADLVYLHLKEIAELFKEDVILAVPGTLSNEQLSVLLGIAREAGLQVVGFVDSAVAAITTSQVPERTYLLDVHLQHMSLTELAITQQVKSVKADEIRDCGLAGLLNGWVNLVADRFVHETRFDPLHTANTEQQIYNQVYDWVVGAHRQTEIGVEIDHDNQQRRVEIPKVQLEQKAQQRFQRLCESLPTAASVALSARCAQLPGLTEFLRAQGYEINLLAATAVPEGCNNHLDLITGADSELRLVTRLPHQYEIQTPSEPAKSLPSHVLHNHIAIPLASPALDIAIKGDTNGAWLSPNASTASNATSPNATSPTTTSPTTSHTTLNGESITQDTVLALGDTIVRGIERYVVIRVED